MMLDCSLPSSPSLIAEHAPWLFFSKPIGLHTARAGKKGGGASLEELMSQLLPANTSMSHTERNYVSLCNRLDAPTSGIVVATRTANAKDAENAVHTWRHLERNGLCRKLYVALVTNEDNSPPPKHWTVSNALDTHKRKISRVLHTEADATRHTQFLHLKTLTREEQGRLEKYERAFAGFARQCTTSSTLQVHAVGCCIYQGARHQIRAHAAHSAHPLWFDVRYTQRKIPQGNEFFFLHHGALILPKVHIRCVPPWIALLSEATQKILLQFYEGNGD